MASTMDGATSASARPWTHPPTPQRGTTHDDRISASPAVTEPRKRKRVALWTLIIWTALMGIWIVSALAGNDCASQTGDQYISTQTAQDACAAGTGIGVVLLIAVWAFVTFCIMAVTVIVRLSRRDHS